jgi:iron complex outermembrane receptor protein
MSKRSLLVTTAWAAMICAGGAAHAATAAAAAASTTTAASDSTTVGEIVVTAERREANLQQVPEAVTAFTAQDRNLKGINTVQDMTNFTPGLTYSSQLDRPAIRGLARSTNTYTADSSVAVYYDDFFSNSTFLVGRDDMLIDQVEVLVGPQGTLYGRNSIGGLINTKSKRPTDYWSGEVRGGYGNFDYSKIEGTISGPLAPGLSFRLSGYLESQTQGWLKNTVPGGLSEGGVRRDPYGDFQLEYKGDKDDIWFDSYVVGFNDDRGGPGALLGTPTVGQYDTALSVPGQITFNPNFAYGQPQPGFVPVGTPVTGPIAGTAVGTLPGGNPAATNIRSFAHNVPTDITVNKAYTFTLHWLHHFDGFDVRYIGGYSQYHYELHSALFANDNSSVTSYQIPLNAPSADLTKSLCADISGFGLCGPLTVHPTQVFNFTTQTDWSSHEITISSTTNSPFQWIAGAYYYWETDNNPITVTEPDQPQLKNPVTLAGIPTAIGAQAMGKPIPAGALAAPNPSGNYYFTDYQDRIQSIAGYAQVDWKITSTIKLTGGLRYTYDWKHAQEETRYILFSDGALNPAVYGSLTPAVDFTPALTSQAIDPGVCAAPTVPTSGPYAGAQVRCLRGDSQALTGTAGIEWTPDPDTLVYARYNRGYKAFALNAGLNGPKPEVAPEVVNDVEIGLKKTIHGNLVIDADAFYYDYHNDQVPLSFIQTTGLASTLGIALGEFINIPTAVSEGIELTADWRPIRAWDINLTYGLDRTVITSNCTAVNGVAVGACYRDPLDGPAVQPGARPVGARLPDGSFSQAVNGNALPQAPENKVAINTNYSWDFTPGRLIASATYVWKDKSYASIFTRSYDQAPSWDEVDFRLTWSGNHDRYEVIAYAKNVLNSIGYDAAASGYYGLGNNPVAAFDLTPPRTYGVEVHYKF